jgi:protein-disulfide isomerase
MTGEVKTLIGIGLVTLALFVVGIVALTKKSSPVAQQNVDPTILVRADSQRTGATEPKVTLVEFSDYQCPFCAQSYPVVEQIVASFPELQFVYRHFPLSQHKYALTAAEAAEAAGAQGKFWEMTKLLMERQTDWAESADALPIFQAYAQELTLDMEQFNQAMTDHTYLTKIQGDSADGTLAGVSGTPSFYVDGVKFSGTLQQLSDLIQNKLQ